MKVSFYSLGIFVLVTAATISGFFLLGIEKTPIHHWALWLLVFSYIITFVLAALIAAIRNNPAFHTASLITISAFYQLSIIGSMLFVNSFNNTNEFIFFEIVVNALYFVAAILVFSSSKYADGTVFKKEK